MPTLLMAALAALLALCASSASAYPNTDDRYFDSRARVQPAKVKVRHAAVRKGKAQAPRKKGRAVPVPRPGAVKPLTRGDAGNYAGTVAFDVGAPQTVWDGAAREVRRAGIVLGGRPAGCPARFCGCGASLHLFGRIIPALNLAANWLRFPRAEPAPDMAAARRGHVFVLKRHLSGKTWLVHDSNSGGRKTRLHPRSIAGYTIVNPRAGPS